MATHNDTGASAPTQPRNVGDKTDRKDPNWRMPLDEFIAKWDIQPGRGEEFSKMPQEQMAEFIADGAFVPELRKIVLDRLAQSAHKKEGS